VSRADRAGFLGSARGLGGFVVLGIVMSAVILATGHLALTTAHVLTVGGGAIGMAVLAWFQVWLANQPWANRRARDRRP
jgi:hypothetical protein